MKNVKFYSMIAFLLCAVVLVGANAFNGTTQTVMENVNIENFNKVDSGESLGAVVGPNVFYDMVFHGTVNMREATKTVAQTGATSTVTLAVEESGSTVLLSATGTSIVLPAVTNTGVKYRFQVNGAMANANMIISSLEGDNVEGTLIVAGAVVDCAGEDQINFVVDGENVGDYVELMSDGTQWLLGDSGVLTAGKMTCTDPS